MFANLIKSRIQSLLDAYSNLCIYQRVDIKADKAMTFCADARREFLLCKFSSVD